MKRCLSLLCVCLTCAVLLCACAKTPGTTVITKPQGDVVIRTDPTTTTTVITTTTTTVETTTATNPDGTPVTTTAPITKPTVSVGEEGSTLKGKAIADLAASLVGTPFKFGGFSPDTGFDNPSFVAYCYKQNGYTVPRKASQMALYGEDVPPDELQVGDILVFCNEVGGDPGFCGIYIGNEQFVSCNNPNSPTSVQKLNVSYWAERFIAARRPAE